VTNYQNLLGSTWPTGPHSFRRIFLLLRASVRLEDALREQNQIREVDEDSSDEEKSSSSESDSSDSDRSEFRDAVDVPKSSPQKILNRLSSDNIGRDCINRIGSNLILIQDQTETASNSNFGVAKKILQSSLSLELSSASAPSPSRVLLKPMSRTEHDAKGHSSSLTSLSDNIMSALKPSALPPSAEHAKGVKLCVNLCDETLYIPGCHGNSVIRFDFFDGEYVLSEKSFLFFVEFERLAVSFTNSQKRSL
jgi:hypothetical protein